MGLLICGLYNIGCPISYIDWTKVQPYNMCRAYGSWMQYVGVVARVKWLTSNNNLLTNFSDTINVAENSISKIEAYPNPNTGTVYVNSYEIIGLLSIEIYNVLGRQVYQNKNYNLATASEINLGNNKKGVFFLKASDGTTIFKEKIVIK